MTGGFYSLSAVFADEPRLTEAFQEREGAGLGGSMQLPVSVVSSGFFRPGYKQHLVSDWLSALDGVIEKLERGAKVADVGCGHGASTLIMAQAFPKLAVSSATTFHDASIDHARRHGNGRCQRALRDGECAKITQAPDLTSLRSLMPFTTWEIQRAQQGHARKLAQKRRPL